PFAIEQRLDEDERLLEAALDARRHGPDLERAGLDAAGVEEVLHEVLQTQRAPAKRGDHRGELALRHREGIVDEEVESGRERGDRRAQLVRDLQQEVLL